MLPLNLFYEEPEGDRWLPYDRYPRRVVRRIVRGAPRPSGQRMVMINLCSGLRQLGIPYRLNDYGYAKKHPEETVCILGKSQVLLQTRWENPILLGPSIECHPLDVPDLLERAPIERIVLPGPWVTDMCNPYWGGLVTSWPVGIDTDKWAPVVAKRKTIDVLIYDKVRWFHDRFETLLLAPIRAELARRGLRVEEIRYGYYREQEYLEMVKSSRAVVFLCEHETQGLAYQQALSCDVPMFAWDRGGYWQDPAYFPERFMYEPVTSVPYWDDRCGSKFEDIAQFSADLDSFLSGVEEEKFRPRSYVLENLTLAKCARAYNEIARGVGAGR